MKFALATLTVAAALVCHKFAWAQQYTRMVSKEEVTQHAGDYICGRGDVLNIVHWTSADGQPASYIRLRHDNSASWRKDVYYSYYQDDLNFRSEMMIVLKPVDSDGAEKLNVYNQKIELMNLAYRLKLPVRIVAPLGGMSETLIATENVCGESQKRGLDVKLCRELFRDVCEDGGRMRVVRRPPSEDVYNY